MQLRDYQRDVICRAAPLLDRGEPTLLVMPTGTGKTVTGCTIADIGARKLRAPVLHVCPTHEILAQTVAAYQRAGWWVDVDLADQHRARPRTAQHLASTEGKRVVIVASLGTLIRRPRLERYPREGWALCILDEAHHSPAPTWLGVREHFKARWLGLSATPEREGMARLWTEVRAFERGVVEAVEQGWLVRPDVRYVQMPEADYEALRGDDEREIWDAMAAPIKTLARELAGRPGVSFWPRVAAARQAAKFLRSHQPEISARALAGRIPRAERELALRQYRAGTLQALTLCQVGAEGLDVPTATVLWILRLTESSTLGAQMLGRVLRPWPGVVDGLATADERRAAIEASPKPMADVLSICPPDATTKWLSPARLLYGHLPEPVILDVERRMRSGLSLEQARNAAEQAEEERERIRQARREEHERRLREGAPARRRAMAEAGAYEVLTEAQIQARSRRDRLASTWRGWADRAKGTASDAPRATEAQAQAISRLVAEWLGDRPPADGLGRVGAAVRQWDRGTAKRAQFALLAWLGRVPQRKRA